MMDGFDGKCEIRVPAIPLSTGQAGLNAGNQMGFVLVRLLIHAIHFVDVGKCA